MVDTHRRLIIILWIPCGFYAGDCPKTTTGPHGFLVLPSEAVLIATAGSKV